MTDELAPPVARFRCELVVTGNTLDEIARELELQVNDFTFERLKGAVERRCYGGRHHLILEERNPLMTPDRYEAELLAWAVQRHFHRLTASERPDSDR